ncbi:hypothetical protein O6H91_13G105100 [Diphasiastrum complanatum]|uniref:Uncharacterized protein n=1 Tax=Diphasiastrum complanatum TaxID=34168 RepID=A0ACC2BY53_DIPCM|nr:hypothetical protein O6H91_13G105100 [Diphasiastrum complanatum]
MGVLGMSCALYNMCIVLTSFYKHVQRQCLQIWVISQCTVQIAFVSAVYPCLMLAYLGQASYLMKRGCRADILQISSKSRLLACIAAIPSEERFS